MKHLKMLGLTALAAMALTALIGAGTASATEVYSLSSGTLGAGTVLDFSLESGTSANLQETSAPNGEGKTLDTCKSSTVKGEITSAGSSTETTTGNNTYVEGGVTKTGITWGSCTFPTTTTVPGKLEIHYTSGVNGTLTADAEIGVTINTIFFGSCVYGVTAGTDLGTLTGSAGGNSATFHANAVAEKLSGSNIACPSTSVWTASYVATSPTDLVVKSS